MSKNNLIQKYPEIYLHATPTISKEVVLWRCVVLQALLDAIEYVKSLDKIKRNEIHPAVQSMLVEYRKSYFWFMSPSSDFNRVCEYADFEPKWIKRIALKYFNNN